MGKVFKAIVIGALVAVGAFFVLPAIGLSAPFAGLFGIESGLLAAAVGGALTGGLSALLAPSMDLRTVLGRARVSVNAQEPMKWVFGETAVATDLVWAGIHGESSQYYTFVIAAAGHLIDSYGTLYINDEAVTFDAPSLGVEDGNGAWLGAIWRQSVNWIGTETQTSITNIDAFDVFADADIWPISARGRGIAYFRLRFRRDHEKFSSGIPTRLTQVAKGGPVYDPRLDSTRGGSGTHRADDQTTWEYNDGTTDIGRNWALVVLRYLIGWKINSKLVIGVGIDPDDIDMDQAIAAANVCEQVVDAQPRYFVDGMLPIDSDHARTIRQLEAIINGKVATVGGKYYIWAPNDDLATFSSIVEADIIRSVGVNFMPSGPMEQLYNTARGRFIDPSITALYQPMPYPEVEESVAVTEDGGVRLLARDFAAIQDVKRAERIARQQIRRSRFGGTWRFAMGPKGLTFQPFSVTTLNIQETNNTNVTVRIIDMSFSISGAVVVECIEEDSSIYDTTAALGTPITTIDPGDSDPNTKIALTGMLSADITIRGDSGTATDGFEVTWDDPGQLVVTTEVQYKVASDTDWIQVPVVRIDLTKAIIWPVQPSTLHDIRARHVTQAGVAGNWVSLQDTSSDNTTARPVNTGAVVNITYDDLDTIQLAAGQSRYAMLTARGDNTSGSQNNFHLTDAILLNKKSLDGTGYSLFYSTIRVGDRITFGVSSGRWYLFEVDETFQTIGSGAAEAYKFGVTLIESVDSDPTTNISTVAGTQVEFDFNQNPVVEGNLLFDPDFDFSTSLPVVATETSAGFWDNSTHWVGLKNMTSPSSSPTFSSWGWTFNDSTGPNNSNTIGLISAIPIISGFTEAWLVARRRIRTNTPSFDIKLRILNEDPIFSDIDLQIQMIGYDSPTSPTPQLVVARGFKLLYTDGITYDDLEFHLEAASDVDAQYWEFRIGFQHVVVQDIGECAIDSIFVYPTTRSFGANTFQDAGIGNAKYHAGLVPQSDVSADAGKVLRADGTWTTNLGSSALSIATETAVNYTLVLSDAFALLRRSNAAVNNTTIPPNSSVAFDIGTQITVKWHGVGQSSFVAGAGVTINTPETLKIAKRHAMVTAIKEDTDVWTLVGQLEPV